MNGSFRATTIILLFGLLALTGAGSVSAVESGRSGAVNSADGVRVAYETRGTTRGRPTLVLVHGWSCDRSYWSAQLDPFSDDFRVVAVDLGGHGASTFGRREEWTISSLGGDVARVVQQLGLSRVILIGHSMGGDVVVDAARRLKGRVVGLVWLDTYSKLGSFRTDEERDAFIAPFRANFAETTQKFVRGMFPPDADQALVDRVANDMASAPPNVALSSMESSFSNDRRMPGFLEELKLPVIAINPESSKTDRASMSQHGVEVIEVPNAGHFLMMEDPDRFNPILREAIDKLGR